MREKLENIAKEKQKRRQGLREHEGEIQSVQLLSPSHKTILQQKNSRVHEERKKCVEKKDKVMSRRGQIQSHAKKERKK